MTPASSLCAELIDGWRQSPFAQKGQAPWDIISRLPESVQALALSLSDDYARNGTVVIHKTACVEAGAVIKGPAVIGPGCFIGAGAYLRGGVWLDEGCIIGPNAEIKTSILFRGSKLAHLNFIGEAIIGVDVNVEAGAVIANYRNELPGKTIRIMRNGAIIDTGVQKFSALVGDHARIGANAVIAPGAIIDRRSVIDRLALVDQSPPES